MIFCNVDGYQITSEIWNTTLTEKGLKKTYRKYKIDKKVVKSRDVQLLYNNLYIATDKVRAEGIVQNDALYIVELNKNQVQVVLLTALNKRDKAFEHTMVTMLLENEIPAQNFAATTIASINFSGRAIELGPSCNWTAVNIVQCPYLGEMNWSVHKELEDAQQSVAQQYAITASQKSGKIISEEQVPIIFVGSETIAKKII